MHLHALLRLQNSTYFQDIFAFIVLMTTPSHLYVGMRTGGIKKNYNEDL